MSINGDSLDIDCQTLISWDPEPCYGLPASSLTPVPSPRVSFRPFVSLSKDTTCREPTVSQMYPDPFKRSAGFEVPFISAFSDPESTSPCSTPSHSPGFSTPELPPCDDSLLSPISDAIDLLPYSRTRSLQTAEITLSYSIAPSSLHTSSDLPSSPSMDDEDSEVDEDESSDGSESEYSPSEHDASPRLAPLTQRGSYLRSLRSNTRTVSRTSSSRSISSSPSPSSHITRISSPISSSRNVLRTKQVKVTKQLHIPEPKGYACPVCKRRQANRRISDLKRHINTHYQEAKTEQSGAEWLCCGVPISVASQYGIKHIGDAKVLPETGVVMIGGCGTKFSRKDAYSRHLRESKKKRRGCVGDTNGSWVPGNAH